METKNILPTRFTHHTLYAKQVIVSARAVELQHNAPLKLGLDPETGLATCITPENEHRLSPLTRYIGDEMDYAELEFAFGALGEMEIVRGPGETNPTVVKVGDIALKRAY